MLMKVLQVVRPRSFATVQVPVPHLSSGNADRLLIQPLSTVMNAVDRLDDLQGKLVAVVTPEWTQYLPQARDLLSNVVRNWNRW